MDLENRINHYADEVRRLESELLAAKACLTELLRLCNCETKAVEPQEKSLDAAIALVPAKYGYKREAIAKTVIRNIHLADKEICNILKAAGFIKKGTWVGDVQFLKNIIKLFKT
jgi:hypothetical protein